MIPGSLGGSNGQGFTGFTGCTWVLADTTLREMETMEDMKLGWFFFRNFTPSPVPGGNNKSVMISRPRFLIAGRPIL